MKALIVAVVMLFAGSVLAGERPAYLTPPQSKEMINRTMIGGFVATTLVAATLGFMAASKTKPNASKASNTMAKNLYTESLIFDGLAAGFLIGTMVTF